MKAVRLPNAAIHSLTASTTNLRSVVGADVARDATQDARHKPPSASWLAELLGRRPAKVAAVAMANKTARIIWAVLRDRRSYQDEPPAQAVAA